MVAFADAPVENPEIGDHSTKGIIQGIEDQCLEWGIGIAFWSRYFIDDLIKYPVNSKAAFSAGFHDFFTAASQ